jgi:hypothetical protein
LATSRVNQKTGSENGISIVTSEENEMIFQIWRLSEGGDDNLGLTFTADGVVLGRTLLIEWHDQRFVVREQSEVERLLRRAYESDPPIERIMSGLRTVARALNADDQCLARIAAVHLRIPDLSNAIVRSGMESEDRLIKYARDQDGEIDWDPAKHPRTGTPPNPGWFAPTDGSGGNNSSPTRTAENVDPARRSDALPPGAGNDWLRLPPGDYIDELQDFLEWLGNANPDDEKTIRAGIKHYYYDVGDTIGGDALNRALSEILYPDFDPKLHPELDKESRQAVLNNYADYAKADPAEMGLIHGGLPAFILPFPGMAVDALDAVPEIVEETPAIEGDALDIKTFRGTLTLDPWKLRWDARGRYLEKLLGGKLNPTFPTIDKIADGMATSIKSIDLNGAAYQNPRSLTARLGGYINDLEGFNGGQRGLDVVLETDIRGRVLSLAIPKGSMTAEQRIVIEGIRDWARTLRNPVNIVITEF